MRWFAAWLLGLLMVGCSWFASQQIPDEKFMAVYPELPESYRIVAEQLGSARSLYEEAAAAVASARLLRLAWASRFALVNETLANSEDWATVALSERWHGKEVSAAAACRDLRGPLGYLGGLVDRVGAALVAWREAQAREVEELVQVRLADRELQKSKLYLEQVPLETAGVPADLLIKLERSLALRRNSWAEKRVKSGIRQKAFEALQGEFDSLRLGLPVATPCPIWLHNDPLRDGRPWLTRQITPPDLP